MGDPDQRSLQAKRTVQFAAVMHLGEHIEVQVARQALQLDRLRIRQRRHN